MKLFRKTTATLTASLFGLIAAPTSAGLVGSVMSYEAIIQRTETSEIERLAALTTATVSATEVEFPMLGELELDVPGIYLINVAVDVGDDYVEFDFANAGLGFFTEAFQNTAILRFGLDASTKITKAELNTAVSTLALVQDDISFSDSELYINFGRGGLYDSSSFFRIDLTTVPVPEPSTLCLLTLSLLTLIRKRR